jgi:DNA repair protein RadA/Sms
MAAFGEVGLTGRLRPVTQAERRLGECAKLGLNTVIAPAGLTSSRSTGVLGAETIRQALAVALDVAT